MQFDLLACHRKAGAAWVDKTGLFFIVPACIFALSSRALYSHTQWLVRQPCDGSMKDLLRG